MKTAPIKSPEDILANPALFASLNPAEKLAAVLSAKSNIDTTIAAQETELQVLKNSIEQSRQNLIAPKKAESKRLKSLAESLTLNHRKEIMGDSKTLDLCGHSIGFRWGNSIKCDASESETVAALEVMAYDETASDADRMSAEACLKRGEVTLDKNFCLKAAKKSAAWLRAFGIRVSRAEKLSIKPLNAAEEDEG